MLSWKYTFGKKGCYTPIWGNKIDTDWILVFPAGWNWHEIEPVTAPPPKWDHWSPKPQVRWLFNKFALVTGPDFNFTWWMAHLGYVIYLVSASSKGTRLIGSKLVVVQYTSGELFAVVPNRLLCSLHRYLIGGLCRGILHNTLVPFVRQHLGDTAATKTITPHLTMLWQSLVSFSWASSTR